MSNAQSADLDAALDRQATLAVGRRVADDDVADVGDDIGLEVVPECVKVMAAAARKVGSQSRWLMISLETVPGLILPGQRSMAGTRKAPSQLESFSLRKGVMAASGQEFMCGPLSVE